MRIGRPDRPDTGDVAFTDAAARSGADAVLAALPDGAETILSRLMTRGGTYHELFSLQARAYADT